MFFWNMGNLRLYPTQYWVEINCQLDATEVFIADLITCSTCFGHHYAHHQELKSIIQWLLPAVFRAVVFKLLVWCGAEGYVSGLQDTSILQTGHISLLWRPEKARKCSVAQGPHSEVVLGAFWRLVSKSCDECNGSFARGCEVKPWSHWTCSSLGTIFQPMRINSVPDVKCFCNNKNVLCAQSIVWHFVRHPVCRCVNPIYPPVPYYFV